VSGWAGADELPGPDHEPGHSTKCNRSAGALNAKTLSQVRADRSPADHDDIAVCCRSLDDHTQIRKLAAERFLLEIDGLDVRVLRLPFVYGDEDPHIRAVTPIMRGVPLRNACRSAIMPISRAPLLVCSMRLPLHTAFTT